MGCPFCEIDPDEIIVDVDSMCGIYDRYPVTDGHMLVIPKDHLLDLSRQLSSADMMDVFLCIEGCQDLLRSEDPFIEGFNIGIDCGEVAGQTIDHVHIHVIPRRKGDVEDPTGGVRNIISGKGPY